MSWRYILNRLAAVIPVLLGVSIIVFLLLTLTPGNPALALLGPNASADQIEALERSLNLDQPLHVQYGSWLLLALQGDLGTSITNGQPVTTLLATGLRNTAIIAIPAMLLATVVGLVVGLISAMYRGSAFDRTATILILFTNSLPAFWLALLLIFFFSVSLGLLPSGGMGDLRGDRNALDLLTHMVLPVVTLSCVAIPSVARVTRSSLIDVLSNDYIRTARSKGLARSVVVRLHALPNALPPVLTVIGLQTGNLLGGAVLTETIFAWPGLGLLMVQAVPTRDLPVIQGGILVAALLFVLTNLVVDLAYALIDPRIRYE